MSKNVSSCVEIWSSTLLKYWCVAWYVEVLWSHYVCRDATYFTTWSYLCCVSYIYLSIELYDDVVVPTSSACYCFACVLFSSIVWFRIWRLSLFVIRNSPNYLSASFIRFCNADTCNRWVEAAVLSFIISALFSEIAVCISEHMRPYCCIVKLFLSIPFDNITYWLCSKVQLSTTFLSKVFMVLLASISCVLRKAVN
jgi:hypothetical protein